MSAEKILNDLEKRNFKAVYWLEGEEEYFIDQVINYAENKILSSEEAEFNLTVLYGRDTAWTDLVNTARKYPMFSDRQVVILKEAQSMKDIDKLEGYLEKPLSSTILFVAYKNKKVDGRTKLAKLIKDRAVYFNSTSLRENELPQWTSALIKSKGFEIKSKALALLVDHIGNDLSRLNNEIDKLSLNLGSRNTITEDDIENFVGISKEYNAFELQAAIAARDLYKAMRIIQYFESNPKAGPLPLIFPSLYNFFSKLLVLHSLPFRDERSAASALGVAPFFVKEYIKAASVFNRGDCEKLLLLIYEYNLRSLGINDAGTEDSELLQELVLRMVAA